MNSRNDSAINIVVAIIVIIIIQCVCVWFIVIFIPQVVQIPGVEI